MSTSPDATGGKTGLRPLRIGFLDHRLDNFHANTYLALSRAGFAERAVIAGCWALDDTGGRIWASANHVPWYDDPARLARDVDAWMVLAPGAPELHPQLCAHAVPTGKPTFVDKTFGADLTAARAIIALADRHGTPVQTGSALRTTNVQRVVEPGSARHVATWGGGRSFQEYAIHPLELAISLLGSDVRTVHRRGDALFDQLALGLSDGRTATVHVVCSGSTPFAAAVTTAVDTRWLVVEQATLFNDAFAAVVGFLSTGTPSIDRRESLAIRAVLDAAGDPRCRLGAMAIVP